MKSCLFQYLWLLVNTKRVALKIMVLALLAHIRLAGINRDEHSRLFFPTPIDDEEKFDNVDTSGQCYKTFFLHH
jgi:hypothetical protein